MPLKLRILLLNRKYTNYILKDLSFLSLNINYSIPLNLLFYPSESAILSYIYFFDYYNKSLSYTYIEHDIVTLIYTII